MKAPAGNCNHKSGKIADSFCVARERARTAILCRPDLSLAARVIGALMVEYTNNKQFHDDGRLIAWPSVETLAAQSGLAARDVHRARSALRNAGLLRRLDEPRSRYQAARYEVDLAAVDATLSEVEQRTEAAREKAVSARSRGDSRVTPKPSRGVTSVTSKPSMGDTNDAPGVSLLSPDSLDRDSEEERKKESPLVRGSPQAVESPPPATPAPSQPNARQPTLTGLLLPVPRATRLPQDWQIPVAWVEHAEALREQHGLPQANLVLEATKFKNYWCGRPGKDATKLDWKRTWLNWAISPFVPADATRAPKRGWL